MCGIAGAIDLDGRRSFPRDRASAMLRAIAHRGPDEEGAHFEPGVFLGARRLSIVDLAGGSQPIANEDGTVWVAFNGELFDYPELRQDLQRRGHSLRTRCDTEVWVHRYEDVGESLFDEARGQYAVSLWDRKDRALLLGRDRVGICPLYYAEADGWLLWASEVRGLLASGMVAARPDPKGLDHVFNFFAASTSRTCFDGVSLLPPGHRLRVRDGRFRVSRYWDLDFPDAGDERRVVDESALVDEFEGLFRHAIRRRLRGDVPVVSYISGGLDSTVVLAGGGQERGAPLPSFTVALDDAGPDERLQAAESAEMLGSELTTVAMDKAIIAETYPDLVRAAEAPVLDTSCACLLRLAKEVHSQGYKVVLEGEGADEALAGYIWFKNHRVRENLRRRFRPVFHPLLGASRSALLSTISRDRRARPDRFPILGTRVAQQESYDLLGQVRSLLYGPSMWDRLDGHSAYEDLGVTNERFTRWHPLNQSLYVGYKVMLAGMLLAAKGDRIAMNASVETRYPFLDEDVTAFCATLAPEYKLRGMTDKYLLRRLAAKILPAPIARRRKTMFRASLSRTFLGADRPGWVDQLLSPESLAETGYFDPRLIALAVTLRRNLPRVSLRMAGLDLGLTLAIATQLWHHLYCGGGLCDLPAWTPPPPTSAGPVAIEAPTPLAPAPV